MKESLKAALKLWYVPATLILIAVVSFFISYLPLSTESLRLDESQSIWQTARSLPAMYYIIGQDVHMPLYHTLFHFWTYIFGDSTQIIRLFSFILFIVSFPFIYKLARTVVSRPWALTVVALVSLSPYVNWYANEARMYTLLGLFTVISQWLFIRIMRGQKNTWPWYVLVCIFGMYSHYFFAFNLMGQALFYLIARKKFPKGTFKKFVGTAIAVAVAVSPWIIYFISLGAGGNMKPSLVPPTPIDFFNVYSEFLFGFQSVELNTVMIAFWPLLVVVALIMTRRFHKPNMAVNYIAVAAFVPVVLAFLISFITPFFLSRYMFAAVVPLYILIVWILTRYSKRVAITAAILIALLTGAMFINQTTTNNARVRENYETVANEIEMKAKPNDVIIMSSPFTVYPFEYYYDGTTQIRTLPIWDRQNPGPVTAFDAAKLPEQVAELRKGHDYVYLILSYDQGYEEEIRDYFKNNLELVSQKTYSPKLEMLVFKVGYADPVSYTR
jgi:mannosyltransferase